MQLIKKKSICNWNYIIVPNNEAFTDCVNGCISFMFRWLHLLELHNWPH